MKPPPAGTAFWRATIAALALLLACAVPVSAQQPNHEKEQKEIHGQGCVATGIERHCLYVRDIRSGKLYNIIVKGIQPAVGTGIQFVGIRHKGPTACMRGTPLDVVSWAHSPSLKCKPAPAPDKPAREK